MTALPEIVTQSWEDKQGPAVLTTVAKDGVPNTVYVNCVRIFSEDIIVIADNYFNKTRQNILTGSKGSLLFLTNKVKAFQIKGSIEYHQSGAIYDFMKEWNPTKHPGHAAAALKVEEVYSGAEKLL
jgi:predicted pyridoxine 5'-phosphate oxidase superfamily flavin-nucleotide-binding protein